ncbi:MAG: hypothetical protein NZ839_03585, partial [Endomicrobia bacterium]|nr:hypothetical protein [Endomicrobiia bacterium]
DDIKDVVIKVISTETAIKSEIVTKFTEEGFYKIIEGIKKIKIPLAKKTVIEPNNPARMVEYLRGCFKKSKVDTLVELEKNISVETIKKIAEKVIEILTDDERFIGRFTDEKNYLRENVSILTNAEALYRLLKIKEEELEQEVCVIKQELEELSHSENIFRINTLFEKYRDFNALLEDLPKINKILTNVRSITKSKNIKTLDLSKLTSKLQDDNKEETELPQEELNEIYLTLLKVKNEIIKSINKLDSETLDILFSLFEKYNISIQPSPLRSKLINRIKIIEGLLTNGIKPEWMILTVLPVLPPDLRPLVAIEGGKFASSDLNEFYRRIIHRNNRLKKFFGQRQQLDKSEKKDYIGGVPKLILLNEKRLLQEAVDALIENSAKKHPVMSTQKRPLKSLTDILKGKQGRFRQNLLGKRIDYSGRSVIVVGPELKLYQCGLPKEMAFELFKPFVHHKLMKKYNISLKKAKIMAEKRTSEVWDIIEEITKYHPVLLNRAPTLHRPSIQAFEPVLVEGKAIQIHPMVCTPYNADFDGDQMAVYVPLTLEALVEAKLLMTSYFNAFSPANGKALIGPTQDVVLGVAYLTAEKRGEKGEGRIFSSVDEAIYSYQQGLIALNARIKVIGINDLEIKKDNGKTDYSILKNLNEWKDYTTVGRLIFNSILPKEISLLNPELSVEEKLKKNKQLGKKELVDIIKECYDKCGAYRTVVFLDDLKKLGYHYATVSGFTISVDDMIIPESKFEKIEQAWKKVKEIEKQSEQGIITEKERYNSIIDAWSEAIEKISNEMIEEM